MQWCRSHSVGLIDARAVVEKQLNGFRIFDCSGKGGLDASVPDVGIRAMIKEQPDQLGCLSGCEERRLASMRVHRIDLRSSRKQEAHDWKHRSAARNMA